MQLGGCEGVRVRARLEAHVIGKTEEEREGTRSCRKVEERKLDKRMGRMQGGQ